MNYLLSLKKKKKKNLTLIVIFDLEDRNSDFLRDTPVPDDVPSYQVIAKTKSRHMDHMRNRSPHSSPPNFTTGRGDTIIWWRGGGAGKKREVEITVEPVVNDHRSH